MFTIFLLGNCFCYFSKIWAVFFPQSGHPDYNTELITAVKSFTLQASGANVTKQYLRKLAW
jgi:hypothetical protein